MKPKRAFKTRRKSDTNGRSFIKNAGILGAVAVFLSVYFSLNSLWSIGTGVVIALILSVGGLQLWIYYEFFHKKP